MIDLVAGLQALAELFANVGPQIKSPVFSGFCSGGRWHLRGRHLDFPCFQSIPLSSIPFALGERLFLILKPGGFRLAHSISRNKPRLHLNSLE